MNKRHGRYGNTRITAKRMRRATARLRRAGMKTAPLALLMVFTEAPKWVQTIGWVGAAAALLLIGTAYFIRQEIMLESF